jgi:hypothetical protein
VRPMSRSSTRSRPRSAAAARSTTTACC